MQAGYCSGHSYYGQFQADREHFADLSLILKFGHFVLNCSREQLTETA